MSSLDITLIGLIALAAWRGFKNGLFVELASLIGMVAGVFGAIYFSGYAGGWLKGAFNLDEKYLNLIAFAVTFIGIVVAITMAGKFLTKIANFASLGIINKLAGAVFGGLKSAFILSVAIMWLNKWGMSGFIFTEHKKEDSIIYPHIEALAPAILPDLIEDAKEIIDQTKKDIDLEPEN